MGILNQSCPKPPARHKKGSDGHSRQLPHNFKSALNRKALVEATTLHDIAKAIIPENIVNKEGSLTEDERQL